MPKQNTQKVRWTKTQDPDKWTRKIFIEQYIDKTNAGIYDQGRYRILDAFNMEILYDAKHRQSCEEKAKYMGWEEVQGLEWG